MNETIQKQISDFLDKVKINKAINNYKVEAIM